MKTEELIKTFQVLDAHKRNVDMQFITPDGKVMDIDNVSLLSSISAANDTPKLTFYVYLKKRRVTVGKRGTQREHLRHFKEC